MRLQPRGAGGGLLEVAAALVALATWLGAARASETYVWVADADLSPCPCDAAKFTFTLEGKADMEEVATVRLEIRESAFGFQVDCTVCSRASGQISKTHVNTSVYGYLPTEEKIV